MLAADHSVALEAALRFGTILRTIGGTCRVSFGDLKDRLGVAEAEIKQATVHSAEKSTFSADHDKIGQIASAFVAKISSADRLITDDGADTSVLDRLRMDGLTIEVVRAGGQ